MNNCFVKPCQKDLAIEKVTHMQISQKELSLHSNVILTNAKLSKIP